MYIRLLVKETRASLEPDAEGSLCVLQPDDRCSLPRSESRSPAEAGSDGALKRTKSDRIGTGGMGEWLKPAVLKCDQGPSASISKFNTTSVQPAVYTRSDLYSCSLDFIRFDRSLVPI